MNKKIKVIQIPAASTAAQMENALNVLTSKGWRLVQIFALVANTFAVLEKIVAL